MALYKTITRIEVHAERSPRVTLLVVLLLASLCFGPWIAIHFDHLWNREHYQFFPMLLAGVVALTLTRFREARGKGLNFSAFKLSVPLLLAAILLMGLGIWLNSPWLGFLAVVCTVQLLFRNMPFGASSTAPLLVLLPLPFSMDGELVHGLQRISSRGASALLDFAGVRHLMNGNVVEVSDRTFFVEEACSGIGSVFLLLASASIYVAWKQLRFVVAIPMLLSAIAWAVAGNTFRIFAVAYAHVQYGMDLSSGTLHESLGSATYLIALLFLMMTEQGLLFLAEPIPVDEDASVLRLGSRKIAYRLTKLWNFLTRMNTELRARRFFETGVSGVRVSAGFLAVLLSVFFSAGALGNLWHFWPELHQAVAVLLPDAKTDPMVKGTAMSSAPVFVPESVLRPFEALRDDQFASVAGVAECQIRMDLTPKDQTPIPTDVAAPAEGALTESTITESTMNARTWTFQFAETPFTLEIIGPFSVREAPVMANRQLDETLSVMERGFYPVKAIANEVPIIQETLFRDGEIRFRHELSSIFTQSAAPLQMSARESLTTVRQNLAARVRPNSNRPSELAWHVRLFSDSNRPLDPAALPARRELLATILESLLLHWRTAP